MFKKNRSSRKSGTGLIDCGATTISGGKCTVQVRPENRGKCGAKHRAPESESAKHAHSSGMYFGAIEQAMMGSQTVEDKRMEPLPLKGQWQRSEVFDPGHTAGDDSIGREYATRYYDEDESVCIEVNTHVMGPPGTGLSDVAPKPENCAVWERTVVYEVDSDGELGDEISYEHEIMHLTKYSFEDLDEYAKECVSDDRRAMYNDIGVDAIAGRENKSTDSEQAYQEMYAEQAASDPALWGIGPQPSTPTDNNQEIDEERKAYQEMYAEQAASDPALWGMGPSSRSQREEELQAARNYETLNGNDGGGFSGFAGSTQAQREAYEREAASDPALRLIGPPE